MSKSLAVAEMVAMEGKGEEWDTQTCIEVQNEFLSSPARTPVRHGLVASSTNPSASLTRRSKSPALDDPEESQGDIDLRVDLDGDGDVDAELDHYYESDDPNVPDEDLTSKIESPKSTKNANPPTVFYRRDAAGKLRPFTNAGDGKLPLDFEEKSRHAHAAVMEDLTQKSSMSLTQENSESVYEQFNRGNPTEDYPSTATPDDGTLPTQANADSLHSRYASTRTESTAVTYQEDDPRHIRVDFNVDSAREGDEDEDEDVQESQDASYAAPQAEMINPSYDPQTPAPPINPFTSKGSVMKGFELFRATQPSSVGRCLETPASGRPSPNLYNDYSSPPKRRRVMSSPLSHTGIEAETSPLQSSVRQILTHSSFTNAPLALSSRIVGLQSFEDIPHEPINEPRAYVSMKESQERRNKRDSTPEASDSDSDDFDDDIPAVPKRQLLDVALRMELASVELRKKRASSRTSSAPITAVDVPSTRRSGQGDAHIPQSEEYESHKTQQTVEMQSQDDVIDDIIVDSQALPPLPQVSPVLSGEQASPQDATSPVKPLTGDVHFATPSRPLQEVSFKAQDLLTPQAQRLLLVDVDTVPETSPPNERTTPVSPSSPASPEEFLRPIGEIASFSYGVDDEVEFLDDMAGLTQDAGFEKARRMGGSSPVAPGIHGFRQHMPVEFAISLASKQDTFPLQVSEHVKETDGVANRKFLQTGKNGVAEEIQLLAGNGGNVLPSISPSTGLSTEADESVTSSLSEISTPPRPTGFSDLEADRSRDVSSTPNTDVHEQLVSSSEEDLSTEHAAKEGGSSVINISEVAVGGKSIINDIASNLSFDGGLVEEVGSDIENELPKHNTTVLGIKVAVSEAAGSKKAVPKAKSSTVTPHQPSRVTKRAKASINRVTEASASTTARSSPLRSVVTPDTVDSTTTSIKRTSKRISNAVPAREESVIPTRLSMRQSTARESSEDPLALEASGSSSSASLFATMAFAIGYVNPDRDRNRITQLITENGGTILQEGFDCLFEANKTEGHMGLRLSAASKQLGFTALVADEHSRKAKFMQALALGLPCISGHWVAVCVSKGRIVEWAPYLLCAGMSSVLQATKSRMLSPYSAETSRLEDVIASRDHLLAGKSVLFVTGKSKSEIEKRKAYTFLTRVLGPARFIPVGDLHEARKKLNESGAEEWDMLYVDVNEKQAEKYVFGPAPTSARGSKRKRVSDTGGIASSPPPKKIRIIVDEIMVQSLIMGQLLE